MSNKPAEHHKQSAEHHTHAVRTTAKQPSNMRPDNTPIRNLRVHTLVVVTDGVERIQITTEDTVPQRLERHPNKKTAGLTDSPFVDSWG